ncbi:MAG: HAMP domain-containing protein [Zetaproteobacteria bacterium]|nr:HAMP domain-containing protein [Zetaproteobacteria bacterium]
MKLMARIPPLALTLTLWGVTGIVWGDITVPETSLIALINIGIMGILSLFFLLYSVRSLQNKPMRAGSPLRSKLVIAFMGILLLPTMIIQTSSHQVVEKGLNIWFDVRVDKVMDQALHLAQGFYSRVDHELKQGLISVTSDQVLLNRFSMMPEQFSPLHLRLSELMQQHNWQSIRIYDLNEHLVANVRMTGLAELTPPPLSEQAKLALKIGHTSTELAVIDGSEMAVGYAPLRYNQKIIGVLQAEITLPEGIVNDAKNIEDNYRSYRELERNRQAIGSLFTHIMLFITLSIVLIAGLIAIFFSRKLTAPIDQLASAVHRITEGDLNVIIPASPQDELGALVESFNQMATRLKQNMQALDIAQDHLKQSLNDSQQRQYILERLLANMQSGALLLSDQGHIRLVNQAFQQLSSNHDDWVIGNDIHNLKQHPQLNFILKFFDEMKDQQTQYLQQEVEIMMGKKSQIMLLRGTCLHDQHTPLSKLSGYLILMDNITDLAEAQRHKAWSEVAQRLAHEIKNPLTPIKLAAERLQRRFRTQVDDQKVFDHCTHAIINQTDRLQRLVGDFSSLARIPKPRMDNCTVAAIFTSMQELYETYSRVHIDFPEHELPLYCDFDQIRQIIINLMNNALAATEENLAPINLYATFNHHSINLHILDEGDGIPETLAGKIFEAYISTKADGSGLGLAIAKRIAEDHQGQLQLLSHAKPTHFCLSLPMQTQQMEIPL